MTPARFPARALDPAATPTPLWSNNPAERDLLGFSDSAAPAGLLLGRPPDNSLDDVEPLIEEGLAEARRRGVTGQTVTPFVLSFLHEESGGLTLEANRELVAANAGLAAEVAVAAA